MTHTIHVTQVGRAMARALGLNEALTEAICLAHDVGHSPFGHTGEDALTPFVDGEWLHSEQGVRTLSILEPQNLTFEVLDGIRAHSWKIDPPPATPEGWLCRFADRIAYLTHDVSDALRAVQVIGDLVNYYQEMPGEVPEGLEGSNPLAAIDYVAGMTDRFALNTWDTLFRPTLNL
jgi:dGTPase